MSQPACFGAPDWIRGEFKQRAREAGMPPEEEPVFEREAQDEFCALMAAYIEQHFDTTSDPNDIKRIPQSLFFPEPQRSAWYARYGPILDEAYTATQEALKRALADEKLQSVIDLDLGKLFESDIELLTTRFMLEVKRYLLTNGNCAEEAANQLIEVLSRQPEARRPFLTRHQLADSLLCDAIMAARDVTKRLLTAD